MSAWQFANSLNIIRRSDYTNRGAALARHLLWQWRKMMRRRPIALALSRSTIMDDEPGNTISMVNMLGRYDFNNMHLVQRLLTEGARPSPVFVDVGANIGAYTLIASEVDASHVVSIEPIPEAFRKLERNIRLNRRSNVTALNLGASKQAGALLMTCNGASSMNQVVERAGGEPVASVPVDTLDTILAGLRLAPFLIKIDVEGHEPEVLAGANAVLAGCMACLIENGDRSGIVGFMRQRGFRGPFYYDHRGSMLRRRRQPVPEDQVFIAAGFAAAFPAIGIEATPMQVGL